MWTDFTLSFSKTVSQESETVPHNDPNTSHSQHFLSWCCRFQAGCVYNSNPHCSVRFLLHPDSEMTASNGDPIFSLNLPCHYPIPHESADCKAVMESKRKGDIRCQALVPTVSAWRNSKGGSQSGNSNCGADVGPHTTSLTSWMRKLKHMEAKKRAQSGLFIC